MILLVILLAVFEPPVGSNPLIPVIYEELAIPFPSLGVPVPFCNSAQPGLNVTTELDLGLCQIP